MNNTIRIIITSLTLYFSSDPCRAGEKDASPCGVKFYSAENYPVTLSDPTKAIIVLRNFHSCQDCFRELDAYLAAEIKNVGLYSLAYCDSGTLERKRSIAISRSLMPGMTPLVSYTHSQDSAFRAYENSITPYVWLVRKNSVSVIPYSSIFQQGETTLQEKFKAVIKEFNTR
jgi:hypothetical protein